MGKATRWFKSLLGIKNQSKNHTNVENESKDNIGSVVLERRNEEKQIKWFREYFDDNDDEQSKHAIAVAAATAAAADAAVAAAQAAVAVLRLTSKSRGSLFSEGRGRDRDRWAALKIQSFFRGYLARRAHRALKGLVKLQAHVRGYLVRKRAAATLYSMQALIRAQAVVRSRRANQAFGKNSKIHLEFRPRRSIGITKKFDEQRNDQFHSKRLSTSCESHNPHEGSPKIVEIDTFKPSSRSRRINPSSYDFAGEDYQYPMIASPLPCLVPTRIYISDCLNIPYHDYNWDFYGDECRISTAQSTPRLSHSLRCNGPSTPTKSICGDSLFRPYSNCPSYMADTQSFRAKMRSQSAPKQRPEGRSKKTFSLEEIMAARNSIRGVRMQRSCSQVQEGL